MKELREITDKVNANLIADIVGHPQGAPSVEELEHMNPSLERDTIQRRLTSLEEAGIVEVVIADPGNRQGLPSEFYRLSDRARTLFDD